MKIGVISLGCAKNLVDTENLLGMIQQSGQELTTDYDQAQAIIINTCGFIESAKSEAIDTILETAERKKKNLEKLIVMGCLAKRYKPQLEQELPEVDCIISIDEYGDLGSILSNVLGVKIANNYGKAKRLLSGKPWMAYVRIADGCDNACGYCAIPSIRGRLKSYPMQQIVEEVKSLVQSGVKEINLIAQDSTRYGFDWDHHLHLSKLLEELDVIEGIGWIRVLYLYPDEIPDKLLETMQQCKHVLPYFDIPVQHGSDRMLKAMNRRSSFEEIVSLTNKIRSMFPNATLRTTLITGYPNETEEDHQRSLELVRQVKWDHLGVFTYSKEEDTPSYHLEDNVSEEVKNERKEEILRLQEFIVKQQRQNLIGKQYDVLVEGQDPLTKMYQGRSMMFAPDGVDGSIRFKSDELITIGSFVRVEITKVTNTNLIGKRL